MPCLVRCLATDMTLALLARLSYLLSLALKSLLPCHAVTLELSNNLYTSVKQLDDSSEFGGGLVGDEHLLVDSKGAQKQTPRTTQLPTPAVRRDI